MRWVLRTVVGLVIVMVGVLAAVLAASYLFNLSTNGEGKPVRELWHGRFVLADGVLTAYSEWGSHGKPIVLVGGFLEPSFVWENVGARLARAGYHVYALDLDGFGYTKRRGPFTLTEWGDQTAGFMRALRIRRPIVAGHSLGAAVAVDLARRGLVSRVVLVDGDALGGGGLPGFVRDLLAHSPLITSALRISTAWDWPARNLLANAYGPHAPKLDHRRISQWTDQLRAVGADRAITEIVSHGVAGFSQAQLRAIEAPKAVVVWGGKDGVDPVADGRRTAHDLGARFVLIPNAGHLTPLTNPAAVVRAIERG